MPAKDRVRLGMVGGGQGAFIGAVHRMAARLDDAYEFVCGARTAPAPDVVFPTVVDGALGVRFIAASIRSSAEGSRWVDLQ